ncbi:MAG: PaaI family thioesterase [Gammaproteobacteria bacterium]|nr:PaaI family thioesterase [Gammaproteobacteria bacterium]
MKVCGLNSHGSSAIRIASESFAEWLGIQLIRSEEDKAVVKLPYSVQLGIGRIHGGAISALVDVAATAAFWSTPLVNAKSRGATVGFTINFLKLAVSTDLTATATVRRRGNTLCTGNVIVTDKNEDEVAVAVVTYKLQHK